MKDEPILETGLHRGFLLAYALTNLFVIAGLAAQVMLMLMPFRALFGQFPRIPSLHLAALPFALPGCFLLFGWVFVLISFWKSKVAFFPDRLSFNTGLFFRTEGHVAWTDIESVFVKRGPIGSLLGYGTLVLIGRAGTVFSLPFMPDFERLRELALTLTARTTLPTRAVRESAPEPLPPEIGDKCASCEAPLTQDDTILSRRSASRFANQILCPKCRSYAPR